MRSLSTLLLFCLLCPWSYADQRSEVEAFQLENGMGVLLKPTEQHRHVSIRLVVGVGFADFSCREKQLPHLLEHLFFSGLDGGDEADLEARMQALGGQWNAYTSEGDTTFVIEAPAATQRQVLDLLLDTITRTELDEPRIAAAKRVIEREGGGHYSHLQRWLDRENLGRGAMDQLAVELGLACSQRAPLAPLGAEQLERLRSDWYVPGNMTLILVGDLDPRLPAYLTRTFGTLEDHELPERRELPAANGHAEARRTLITRPFGEGAMLHWIYPEPDDADPDAMVLLQAYMNDALYADLRVRRGLTYGPSTDRQVFANQASSASTRMSSAATYPPPRPPCASCSTASASMAWTRGVSSGCNSPSAPGWPGAPRATRRWRTITGARWPTTRTAISPMRSAAWRRSACNRRTRWRSGCSTAKATCASKSRYSTTTCSTHCCSPPVSWPAACSGSACAAGAPDRATGPGGG